MWTFSVTRTNSGFVSSSRLKFLEFWGSQQVVIQTELAYFITFVFFRSRRSCWGNEGCFEVRGIGIGGVLGWGGGMFRGGGTGRFIFWSGTILTWGKEGVGKWEGRKCLQFLRYVPKSILTIKERSVGPWPVTIPAFSNLSSWIRTGIKLWLGTGIFVMVLRETSVVGSGTLVFRDSNLSADDLRLLTRGLLLINNKLRYTSL